MILPLFVFYPEWDYTVLDYGSRPEKPGAERGKEHRMDQAGRKTILLKTILKKLFFYVFVPALCLGLPAAPAGNAARGSDPAVFLMLLAAAGAVLLNWLVYSALRGKHPPLLVYAYGAFCLLIVVIILSESLPSDHRLKSTLAVIGGHLGMASAFLFSLWCASPRRSKLAHSTAIVIWVLLGLTLCCMIFQVLRDIEVRCVSLDTWINIASTVVFIVAFNLPWILAVRRRSASRRRAAGLAEGRIVQIVGETHLDRDGDLVTLHHARVQYTVDDVPYETRAGISLYTIRKFGRKVFIGRTVPVSYDPSDPAHAYTDRIDRHFFDRLPAETEEDNASGEEEDASCTDR